jgi:acid phosphatase
MGVVLLAAACAARSRAPAPRAAVPDGLRRIEHLVVIYEENRSFDGIWGRWPGVDGLASPVGTTPHHIQVDADGKPYDRLPQNDPNLVALSLPNRPFRIDDHIPASAKTCGGDPVKGTRAGDGEPGGCTRDLVHRFYQEQFQIDGRRMDRYTLGSSAQGLTQGYYDTTALPLYRYLTTDRDAPPYVIADHFFHAAFGGSFLNHIWLVSARTPSWPGAGADLHAVVGSDGFVPDKGEAGLHPTEPATKDGMLTQAAAATGACIVPQGAPTPPSGTMCGDFVVNTAQPAAPPFQPGTPDERRLPSLQACSHPTIADEMGKDVDWAWYAGGWDDATGNTSGRGWTNGPGPACRESAIAKAKYPACPDELFQFHHQPFVYFAAFADADTRKRHLKDEKDFFADLHDGRLPAVAFVKPLGNENEHPGYTDLHGGDRHLVDLVKAIEADTKDWPTTAIVVTYDENGGSWDHVPPPHGAGDSDRWGPGTRVPAMIISPLLPNRAAVDHTSYDTTSILTTIEHRFGLAGHLSPRPDVPDLSNAFGTGVTPLRAR